MHNKFGIRALALVLAMVMVLGLAPAASASVAGASHVGAYKTIADYLEAQKTTFDQVDPQAEVEFIVELEDAPLADSIPAGMKLADYLDTRKGSVQANAIEQQQAVMATAIETCADDVAIIRTYQVVLNGFAVSGKYADKAALEAIPGVKRVSVGNTYNVPELQDAEGELITSGEMMNSDAANAEGYTGKGTFAAVLDTGLKVDHEAFIGDKVQGAVITAETIAAVEGLNASGNLYKNAKVAFAYDYADKDDDVSDVQGHGTHVAGTVAANGESFIGVAPDAQLAIMKVFSSQGGAKDSDILAALEDCVVLGVDTVNMSLGSPCGFTFAGEAVDAAYNAVRNAGINLMISAGNDFNSAFQNLHGTDLALAGNPDYGIVGSPSTYAAGLSVASVNESKAYASFFKLGETKIAYDENPDAALKFSSLDGDYAYVRVGGVGNANDFAKVDVQGKIALVERGELAFTEKEQNAYNAGAVAMLVYNNTDAEETVYMQLNGLIPAVFLSKAEGKLLKDAASKVITCSPSFSGRMESVDAGTMSDFSSMGVAPDLSLKPEITAPGGNVWSTSNTGGYEEMSGTSMAAPHMTGAAAVMHQYVNETYPELSDFDKQALIDNLLMSTAEPVIDPTGVAYTPRKQGAGLTNVSAAIHAESYLTVNGGRPKAELGESEEGIYSFTVTVHNLADTAKTWTISAQPIAAQVEEIYGENYISELCRAMNEDEITFDFSAETVTVQPGQTADITVTITLTAKGKQALSVFPNGIYVEGFIRLTGDDAASLGLPYLGFYGDWADAPIFDSTMYDDVDSFIVESAIAQMDYNGNGNYLGINAITGNTNADWISYASRTAGYYLVTPMQGLLRAPKEIWYTAYSNEDLENPVYGVGYGNTYKSFYYTSGGYIYSDFVQWSDSWQPIGGDDEYGYYYLDDGAYTYRIDARIDGEEEYQTSTYPIFIDNEAPVILGHTYEVIDGTPWLTIRVSDNHFVMAAQLVDEDYTKALSGIVAVEETELGAVTELKFDLTDVQADGYKLCRLDLYDYAWNELLSDVISTVSQDIEPQTISLSPYVITASVTSNDSEIVAYIDPANAVNQELTWHSTDESVAKVASVSEDTHSIMVDYVGPGSCQIVATAVNGVQGICEISIAKPTKSWPSDNVIREDGWYEIPANLNTTVTITDNAHNVSLAGANSAANPYSNLVIKSQNDNLALTIENLHLMNGVNYSYDNGILFTGTGNTLRLVGENSIALADYSSVAAICVPDGVELTVEGTGTLTVKGNHNAYGAGIGSNAGADAGKIVINGGSFVFDGMNAGAGIGTGSGNAKVDITINGGSFDVAMDHDTSGYNGNLAYCGAAIGTGNAATGGWSSPYKTMKITINGGNFEGYTNVDSPIIGVANGSGNLNAVIDINGGTFDLLTEDTVDNTMTGGACIGTGTQGYYGSFVADITINGGVINAVSKSNGAAIGGGPGMDGGNIYIFGGTITAISEFEADAIGAGTASPKTSNNVRIDGGTVKAISIGSGEAFRDATLTNDDSDAVFLVMIEAPEVTSVVINGKDWGICANHPNDDYLYLYLPASTAAYEVVVNGEDAYEVIVTPAGKVTVTPVEPAEPVDTTALAEAYAAIESIDLSDYTLDSWYASNISGYRAKAYAVLFEGYEMTQEEIDALTANIWAGVALLVPRGDLSALSELYEQVSLDWDRLSYSVFPEEVTGAFLNVFHPAGDFLNDFVAAKNYTQADVDAVYDALLAAWQTLKDYPVNTMYTDVPAGQWYYDAVDFVTRYGIMNGMDAGAFNAAGNVNRAQFVTILYRIAGQPAVSIDNPFVDVPAGTWFTDAVLWAYENGITTGADATHFNPGGTLVRQNMVTFLMRFAKVVGVDTTARADLSGYTDAGQIADHAQDAMSWAVAEGIISGMSATTLAPNGLANRAQIATIIQRFVQNKLW